jgi:hypothetical protein
VTTLWASTARYRDSFTFLLLPVYQQVHSVRPHLHEYRSILQNKVTSVGPTISENKTRVIVTTVIGTGVCTVDSSEQDWWSKKSEGR